MKKQIFKYSNIEVKSTDEGKRIITAIASVEKKDLDGDIVRIGKTPEEGLDIRGFRKNPVILFGHNSHELPVAKAIKVWKEAKKLMMKIQFPEPEVSSVADTIYKMIKGGFIKALSIGFKPNWETAKKIENGGYDFINSILFETSIVPIPANPGAMVISKDFKRAVEDGVIDEVELGELELYLKDLDLDNRIEDVLDKMNEEIEENEKSTDDIEGKSEQNNETDTEEKEFDPYSYIFESLEDETKEEKEEDEYDRIYDLLGLNDS